MTKPIRPEDVVTHKQAGIPPRVLEVFNDLIAENYNSGQGRWF